MIFFGHIGITIGTVKIYEKLSKRNINSVDTLNIDYRGVLIGSILPDLIDKPIGAFFFRNTFHNSRILGHTLLFSILLLIIGTISINRKRKDFSLQLGVGSTIHLILDSMWLYPGILFWPYFGLKFPERPEGNWLESSLSRLVTDPSYFLPELFGFIITAYFFIKLIKNKQLKAFICHGIL